MGSDAFLAWSEHWPEVMKVEEFSSNYIEKARKREDRLTEALVHAMERLAKRNGVERPRFGWMFPLKDVNWTYATPIKTHYTSFRAVNWDKSACAPDACPGIARVARRIVYVQKKYTRRYFACCDGNNRISERWVDTDLLWLGKGENFGYILRGYNFDGKTRNVYLYEIISIENNYYYPQDWEEVRQNAARFISKYENPNAAPRSLQHVLEVADTVLATGQPENFRIAHSY